MRKNNNKTKTLVLSATMLAFTLVFGGCEQNFFVSPSELLTPPAGYTATPTKEAVATPTPAPDTSKAPSDIPKATDTPTPEIAETPEPSVTEEPEFTPTPEATATPSPIPLVKTDFDAPITDPSDYTFIVNREHPLPDNYVPEGLTAIRHSLNPGSTDDRFLLRSYAAEAFDAMCDDAWENSGLSIVGVSGYRSYERQYTIYTNYIFANGISHTNYYSAQPGTSEHQTGLAIDISCQSCGYDLVNSFARSAEGRWIAENCWRFGFILRYSEDDVMITGYSYEPWHIRYVGIPLAYYLYYSGQTLEEYYKCPSTVSREYLDKTPLVDTADVKFANKYYEHHSNEGVLAYTDETKTRVLINPETYMPYLIPYLRTPDGVLLQDYKGNYIVPETVVNYKGQMFADGDSGYILTKPALFINNFLWSDDGGNPFYSDPLIDNDGNLVYDSDGKVLFKEILHIPNNSTIALDAGDIPIIKTPKRDKNNNVSFDHYGNVQYYLPYEKTQYEYITDVSGYFLWPDDYARAKELDDSLLLTADSPLYPTEDATDDTDGDDTVNNIAQTTEE